MGIFSSYISEAYENMDISAEKINELCDYFSTVSVDEANVMTDERIRKIKLNQGLAEFGIFGNQTYEYVYESIQTCAKDISNIVKTDGFNKESNRLIGKKVDDLFDDLARIITIKNIDNKEFSKYEPEKIKQSFELFFAVLIINTLLSTVLTMLFLPIAQVLTAVIVAPIVEESAKRIAAKGNFDKEFAVVFNVMEWSLYVFVNARGVEGIGKIRLFPVAMHLTTTIIHFLSKNQKLKKLLKLDKPEDQGKLENIGHVLGMLIHAIWNGGFSSVVVGKFIKY